MRVLSVDWGATPGYICINPDTKRTILWGKLGSKYNSMEVQAVIATANPHLMLVEAPFIGRKARGTGLITMLNNRSRWITLADLMDVDVESVYPTTWQKYYRDLYGYKFGDKENYIKLASKIMKQKKINTHIADSVLVSRWWCHEHNYINTKKELRACWPMAHPDEVTTNSLSVKITPVDFE
jgi:hypothetical protein